MSEVEPNRETRCAPFPKHKMSLLTFAGLLIPVYFVPAVLNRMLPDQSVLVTFVAVAIIVCLMSYVIMPFLQWTFRHWIFPKE